MKNEPHDVVPQSGPLGKYHFCLVCKKPIVDVTGFSDSQSKWIHVEEDPPSELPLTTEQTLENRRTALMAAARSVDSVNRPEHYLRVAEKFEEWLRRP